MDRKRILIAEDEEILNEMLVEELEEAGFEAIGKPNGKEALEYLKTNKVDFIISDINMPELDGIEFLKKVREIDPKIPPFLVVTGFSDLIDDNQAKELGAIDLFLKPFKFEQIIVTVQENI